MSLSINKRGLYGQSESNAAADNAARERLIDMEKSTIADGARLMATSRRKENDYVAAERRLTRKGAMVGSTIARPGQRAALQEVAEIAENMRDQGIGVSAIYGAIESSRGIAAHLDRVERCTQIAPLAPADDENTGKARIRGKCALLNNAARNGLLEKYSGGKPKLTIKELRVKPLPITDRDCGKDDHEGDTNKRYIV